MTHRRRPCRRRLVALLLLTLFVAQTGRIAAQTVPCVAIDRDDLPRNCTFMEKWGQCLYEAEDSFEQCWEEAQNGFGRMACDIARTVDGIACHVASPFTLLRGLS